MFAARGRVFADQGKIPASLSDLDWALSLRPNDPATLLVRGNIYDEQGWSDAAIGDFDQALQIDQHNVSALIARARVYGKQGNFDNALKDANSAEFEEELARVVPVLDRLDTNDVPCVANAPASRRYTT